MNRRTLILWAVEFICVTAIGILPSVGVSLWWVGLPAAAIVGTKLLETKLLVRDSHLQVRQQLHLLLTVLPKDDASVRCTYHIPAKRIWRAERLIQAFDYVGDQGGGGRSFDAEKGIIGVAYSAKATRVENFLNDEEYRQRMVNEYRYTQAEVGHRRADRRSYLCDPILDEDHKVLGLLYFDSDRHGLFTLEEDNPRWRMIRAANVVIRGPLLE